MGDGKTIEWWDTKIAEWKAKHGNGNGHGKSLSIEVRKKLLPTPRAQNGESRNMRVWERPADQPQNIENALAHVRLLPTSTARGHKNTGDLSKVPENSLLQRVIYNMGVDWGEYTSAITHHASVVGRPPPPPYERVGNTPYLSPRFVEWMMGLRDGKVSSTDLSRAAQLRLLGNGVVPQQAEFALSILFERAGVHGILDP